MITRYALFQGSIKEGQTDAFRAYTQEHLVPLWTKFTGAQEVRVMFSEERDEGAPEFPLILAISYPDRDAMAQAMESPARFSSKEETGKMVAKFFDGIIHHHVTLASHFDV